MNTTLFVYKSKWPIVNEYCEGKVESIYGKSKEEPEVYYLWAYEASFKICDIIPFA